jgi:hypothetical protein
VAFVLPQSSLAISLGSVQKLFISNFASILVGMVRDCFVWCSLLATAGRLGCLKSDFTCKPDLGAIYARVGLDFKDKKR